MHWCKKKPKESHLVTKKHCEYKSYNYFFFLTGILFLSITDMYNFNSSLVVTKGNKAIIEKKFCCSEFLANKTDAFQDKISSWWQLTTQSMKNTAQFFSTCVFPLPPLCQGSWPWTHRSEKCTSFEFRGTAHWMCVAVLTRHLHAEEG